MWGSASPRFNPDAFLAYYRLLEQAGRPGTAGLCHGLYRGGLGVHLALCSLAAGLGLEVDLSRVAPESPAFASLYAESAGRFLVSVDPAQAGGLEELFAGHPLTLIGQVGAGANFKISRHDRTLVETDLETLRAAWERRFGGLV